MIVLLSLNESSSQFMTSWKEDPHFVSFFLKLSRNISELISYGLNSQILYSCLKARINSIGKARENSIVEKDVKKIKKC